MDLEENTNKELSVMDYDDARTIYDPYKAQQKKRYKTVFSEERNSKQAAFLGAVQTFGQSLEQLGVTKAPKLLWGQAQITQASIEDWLGDSMFGGVISNSFKNMAEEDRKAGQMNIMTAGRNIDALRKDQEERRLQLTRSEADSFVFKATTAGLEYGSALALAYVSPALAMGYMGTRMAGGTAIEGLEQYKKEHPEDTKLTGFIEKAPKELVLNMSKTFVNEMGEYVFGAVGQLRRARKMVKTAQYTPQRFGTTKAVVRGAIKGAAEEYAEEGLIQNATDTMFDYMLGRYKNKQQAVEDFKENAIDAVYPAMFGSAFGGGSALYARAKAINAAKELLSETVPAKDLDNVARVVVENEIKNIRDVATVSLNISSQLTTQTGEVYDAFKNAAYDAMKASGGYQGMSDEEMMQHADDVAGRFSQEVVGEAIKRGLPVQEVITSKDIVYRNGEIHLAESTDEKTDVDKKIKKAVEKQRAVKPVSLLSFLIKRGGLKDEHGELTALDARKGRVGLINNKYGIGLDEARELAVQYGYFGTVAQNDPSQTTVSDLLDLIDKELRGQKVYTEEDQARLTEQGPTKKELEEYDDEYEYHIERYFEDNEIDYTGWSFEQKKNVYEKMQQQALAEPVKVTEFDDGSYENEFGDILDKDGNILFQSEQLDLAEEIADIDAYNDEYTGETVNIDGVEKTVYNSNGDRIAKSEEGLRAFYKWFGDSKVVDEQGRPLVVYHGTNAQFDTFKGTKVLNSSLGVGFNFAVNKDIAEGFGKIMPVYLNVRNPINPYATIDMVSETYEEDFETENREAVRDAIYKVKDILENKGYTFYNEVYSDLLNVLADGGLQAQEVFDGLLDIGSYIEEDYDAEKLYNDIRDAEIESFGFDGYYERNYGASGGEVYVAWHPNQIKSVENRGTFSTESDNIYYQTDNKIYSVFDLKVGDSLKAFGKVEEIDNKERKIKIGGEWYSMFMLDSEAQRGGLTLGEQESTDIDKDIDNYDVKVAKGDRTAVEEQKSKNSEYNKLAKEYYGTTNKLSETGYILTDGSLLDFSGKKFGGSPNNRSIDHREIVDALDEYKAGMEEFINSGNIRYLPEGDKILLSNEPTPQQYKVIEKIINNNGGNITVELMNDANKWGMNRNDYYGEYEDTTFNKVKRDIKAFYTGEGVREITTFFQTAFAGSRVDYDTPSLEAIGSGEGAQVHGYGLYYALNRDVAEGYRETFTQDKFVLKYGDKTYTKEDGAIFDALNDTWFAGSKEDALDGLKTRLDLKQYEDLDERDDIKNAIEFLKDVDENKIELAPQGQVHEVDIPEMPVLLDEQKPFSEQSDFVKEKITNIMKNLPEKYLKEYPKMGIERVKELDFMGGEIYGALVEAYGSDKMASNILEKNGIKGITYFGEQDGRCFVIFNPKDVNVIQKFYQVTGLKGKKIKRGEYNVSKKAIKLFEGANTSTLPHELAHYWLDSITDFATSGRASQEYMAQYESVMRYLGVPVGEKLKDLSKPQQRKAHEKFATSYEKYVMRGIFPTPAVGRVFDGYDKWLKNVYGSLAEISKRSRIKSTLTPQMVQFFDSMTTGELPDVSVDFSKQEEVETRSKEIDNNIKETEVKLKEISRVKEENRRKIMTPVQTDTKTGYLTAYKKMTGEKVEAGSYEMKDQYEKAKAFVESDIDRAKRVVEGVEEKPEGILMNAIYIAYNDYQKSLGNTADRAKALLNQALELRAMGQEIAYQRVAYDSTFSKLSSPTYWIEKVISEKEQVLAEKAGITTEELNNLIDKKIEEGVNQGKTAKEIAQEISDETGLTLMQEEDVEVEKLEKTFDSKIAAYRYAYSYVNKRIGKAITEKEALEITQRADAMLMSLENSIGDNGNPSLDYFKKLSDMEAYANSLSPSSLFRVYADLIGPTNLMMSIKTPLFNVEANVPVALLRMVGRRAKIGQYTSIVEKDVIKNYKKRSLSLFAQTGYNLSTMTSEAPEKTILGEKTTHFEGIDNRGLRWVAQKYNEFLKWGIGGGDIIFKDFAFVDSVSLQATKMANGDVKKANELFEDAVRVEPKTEEGKAIRLEAMTDALLSTYQNNGLLSTMSLKIREGLNVTGLGKFFIAFAKTPANVIAYSAKKTFDPFIDLGKLIIKGKASVPNIKETFAESALAYLISAAIVFLGTDDDDYMPPYALASEKDRQLARDLNIPYNSVRFGDTWYSLDIVGPLGGIVSGMLQARREEGMLGSGAGFLTGSGLQLLSVPGIGGVSTISEKGQQIIDDIRSKKADEAAMSLIDSLVDTVYSRTVPAISSDIAKALDPYEREAKGLEKIQKKIPIARNLLEKKVSQTTGEAEKRGGDVSRVLVDLFVGARIKEQIVNNLSEEFLRLNYVGEGVSLGDVTRSGDLRNLDDDKKAEVRREFAEEFSNSVNKIINRNDYAKKTDEEKKNAINDIRKGIVKKLKKKYKNFIAK